MMRHLITKFQMTPYVKGGGSWAGMDCWGLVETFYREWLDVSLQHRGDIPSSPHGLQKGFDSFHDRWQQIEQPENCCLVIMRTGRLIAGHVGIYIDGGVLHTEKASGCVYQPYQSRVIAPRVTYLFRHIR